MWDVWSGQYLWSLHLHVLGRLEAFFFFLMPLGYFFLFSSGWIIYFGPSPHSWCPCRYKVCPSSFFKAHQIFSFVHTPRSICIRSSPTRNIICSQSQGGSSVNSCPFGRVLLLWWDPSFFFFHSTRRLAGLQEASCFSYEVGYSCRGTSLARLPGHTRGYRPLSPSFSQFFSGLPLGFAALFLGLSMAAREMALQRSCRLRALSRLCVHLFGCPLKWLPDHLGNLPCISATRIFIQSQHWLNHNLIGCRLIGVCWQLVQLFYYKWTVNSFSWHLSRMYKICLFLYCGGM